MHLFAFWRRTFLNVFPYKVINYSRIFSRKSFAHALPARHGQLTHACDRVENAPIESPSIPTPALNPHTQAVNPDTVR